MIVEIECGDTWADTAVQLAENINGIGGKTLITAIAAHLMGKGDQVDENIAEDFGWCFDCVHHGARYLITAMVEPDEPEIFYGVIGVNKHRGLLEKFLGKNKMDSADHVMTHVHEFLEQDQNITLSGGWEEAP